MGSVSLMVNQVIMLLIIAALGMFLRRLRVLSDPVIKGMNKLLMTVTTPAMVLMVTQKEYRPEMMKGFAQVLVVGIVAMSLGTLGAFFFYARGKRKRFQPVAAMLSGMPNAGYIGLPIVGAVYGEEGTLFLAAYIIAFNLVEWTLAVALFEGAQLKAVKNMLNPGFIFTIIGTLLYILKITLPAPLRSTADQLGSVNTPLSLLLLGARMETLRPKHLMNLHLWIPCALRLFAFPLLTLGICRLMGMSGMALGVAVLSTGMPAAAASQMFAEKYDREVAYASVGVSISTILCIVSLPILMLCIGS